MKPVIVIITGLSGSGKTVALRALEDSKFFCVDNLPIALINSFISNISRDRGIQKIGIGIDIREKGFLSDAAGVLTVLRKKYRTSILFLETEKDVLFRRFKETRRPHPLGSRIEESIKKEQKILAPLRETADKVIDTSSFSPHQLRQLIISQYGMLKISKSLAVTLISFGFKFGTPQNIDMLFDVRFLPNPYFVAELKHLKGTERKVAGFVLNKPETKLLLNKIQDLFDFLIPLYIREGRANLTIGIGCTGGNHRSPAIVERFSKFLKKHQVDVKVVHRDIT
jgi:UPF0042 nucleotide-binding protein